MTLFAGKPYPLLLLFLVAALVSGCATQREAARDDAPPPGVPVVRPAAEEPPSDAERLGIEPVQLALTGRGAFLDFRYKVVDAEKAKFILRRTTTDIALLHPASGRAVGVFQGIGKLGRLKQTTYAPEEGRIYFMVFRNPGTIRPGDRVILRVEDYEIPDLVVE